MVDTLERWEKWPIAALFGAQGLQIAEWYISKRMPEQVTSLLPWIVTLGGIAAMVAIDGAMIAAVMGARAGRRGLWTWIAIGVTALFGALVALDLNGAIVGFGPWLHAGFAVTIAAYLMHLIQPRVSTDVDAPSSRVKARVNVSSRPLEPLPYDDNPPSSVVNVGIFGSSMPLSDPPQWSMTVDSPSSAPAALVDAPSSEIDDKPARVKALVDGGMTITQAASSVGVSRQTASKYVKGGK